METALVDEKKLEELVEKAVKKHIRLTFEDVDEMRRSPAGALIRIESALNALEARIERDMVTRAEHASTRAELKDEIASTRAELKGEIASTRGEVANNRTEVANTRAELKDEIASTRVELKSEIANTRTDVADNRTEVANTRTELKDEMAKLRDELKDDNWKLRLLIIILGIILILTNPKVIELIGNLFNLFKP
jgi:uncharacterized protein involved in exopolysaccharide biosynthesis